MMTEVKTSRLALIEKAAKALVDAVSFDDCGTLIGGKYIGGNGGLISSETIKKADELRRALATVEEVKS